MSIVDEQSTFHVTGITADDIQWTLPPVPLLEDVDTLSLTEDEFRAHYDDMKNSHRWYRLMAYEALAMVARQEDTVRRQSRTIDALRRELRGPAA